MSDDPKKAPELPDDHDPDRVPGHPEPVDPEPVDPNRPNPAGPPQPAEDHPEPA